MISLKYFWLDMFQVKFLSEVLEEKIFYDNREMTLINCEIETRKNVIRLC